MYQAKDLKFFILLIIEQIIFSLIIIQSQVFT